METVLCSYFSKFENLFLISEISSWDNFTVMFLAALSFRTLRMGYNFNLFFFLKKKTTEIRKQQDRAAESLSSLQEVHVCSLTVDWLYLYRNNASDALFFCTVLCTWKCRFLKNEDEKNLYIQTTWGKSDLEHVGLYCLKYRRVY